MGYLVLNGKCTMQNPQCRTVDLNSGGCQSCWPGYTLVNSNCLINQQQSSSGPNPSSDPYCLRVTNGICSRCSNGYYYSLKDNACTQFNPLCKLSN